MEISESQVRQIADNKMAITRTLFGRIKAVACDRCGRVEKPGHAWAVFCANCDSIPATSIRNEDISYIWRASTKGLLCSLCSKPGYPESFTHVCIACYAQHPDTTHGGSWGYAPHRVGNIEVDDCYWCYGICIREKTSERDTRRIYYNVGKKGPANGPYVCLHNYEEVRAEERNCEHDYVEVYSNARTEAEAGNIEADLRQQPVVMSILRSDMAGLEHNLAYASEGSTHFWCWKCGFYRNLNPSRYSLLPAKGDGNHED